MKTLGRWVVTVCVWLVTGTVIAAIAAHWIGNALASLVFLAWYGVCLVAIKRLMGARRIERTPDRAPTTPADVVRPRPAAPSRFDPAQHIYGVAGGAIGGSTAFSQQNQIAGIVGERKTGAILDPLLASSNAYLWHGIWWPGSQTSDVDHVIAFVKDATLYLLCIDSKQWKRGVWSYDGEMTFHNGAPAHQVKMSNAVEAMQRTYSSARMPCIALGLVVIHGANSVSNNVPATFTTRIVTADGLRSDVRGFLKGAQAPPRSVCEALTAELKTSERRTLR